VVSIPPNSTGEDGASSEIGEHVASDGDIARSKTNPAQICVRIISDAQSILAEVREDVAFKRDSRRGRYLDRGGHLIPLVADCLKGRTAEPAAHERMRRVSDSMAGEEGTALLTGIALLCSGPEPRRMREAYVAERELFYGLIEAIPNWYQHAEQRKFYIHAVDIGARRRPQV